jgi:hypothetical protein
MRNEIEVPVNASAQPAVSYETMYSLALIDIQMAVASTAAGVAADLLMQDLEPRTPSSAVIPTP